MTSDELWKAVGGALAVRTLQRKWTPIDIERAGGPHYKTVQRIDRGEIGNIANVERYANVLGTSVVELLQTILKPVEGLTPEMMEIAQRYERMTVRARSSMLSVAMALSEETPSGEK